MTVSATVSATRKGKTMHRNLLLLLTGIALLGAAAAAAAGQGAARWTISLTSNRQGDSEIYSMNADGSGVRRLTHTPGYDGFAVPSPNGRKLLFYRNQGGVWVMNADGSGKRDLTPNGGGSPGGWSPDGKKIVFDSGREGNNEIYVMSSDGSAQRNLSPSPSSDERAAGWSPDGRTILFASDRDGNWDVYVMNADGSNPRNLTRNPGNDGGIGGVRAAVWSPDGRRIAFASTRDTRSDDNPEIYVMNVDGSGLRRLTREPGIEAPLSWSPDGQKLAYQWIDHSKPRWAFYVMNADGSGVRKVTWSLPRGK